MQTWQNGDPVVDSLREARNCWSAVAEELPVDQPQERHPTNPEFSVTKGAPEPGQLAPADRPLVLGPVSGNAEAASDELPPEPEKWICRHRLEEGTTSPRSDMSGQ
jgi:hypothetical protein